MGGKKWVKELRTQVFKNVPSKMFGRQPLKNSP